jgi:excisionase family DNA binding protein
MTTPRSPSPVDDPFYNVADVARIFATSDYTVRRWLKSKKITGVKVGKNWKIRESEIKRLAEEEYGGPVPE